MLRYPWVLRVLQLWVPRGEWFSHFGAYWQRCFNKDNCSTTGNWASVNPPSYFIDLVCRKWRLVLRRFSIKKLRQVLHVLLPIFTYSKWVSCNLHFFFGKFRNENVLVRFLNRSSVLKDMLKTYLACSASTKALVVVCRLYCPRSPYIFPLFLIWEPFHQCNGFQGPYSTCQW